jgi:hypothetical protein
MNASAPLQADREQIQRFVDALFRYAEEGSFVSLRAFHDDASQVFKIGAHRITADRTVLVDAAFQLATAAARADRPVVFAPPIATFADERGATEANLQNGLCLSVECDSAPEAARQRLEQVLGRATIVVASGGEWPNPETGELEPKLHLHWRLTEPTSDPASHAQLKRCRGMASDLVGGDGTSKPMVHPMRWPGSWHRKGSPRLARIVAETETELDLDEAEEQLRDACALHHQQQPKDGKSAAVEHSEGETRDSRELVRAITSGSDYHAPTTALAIRYLKGGMSDAQTVLTLQGLMQGVPEAVRDIKDGVAHPLRWQSRYDDIPRAVRTARAEIDAEKTKAATDDLFALNRVDDFRLDIMTAGEAPRQEFLLTPLMPLGKVGLLFGTGGLGKSLVALALCLAVATRDRGGNTALGGPSILGGHVPLDGAGASVFLTLEDDTADIHRRIASLDPENRRHGAPCYVIPGVDLLSFDPALVEPDGRAAALTWLAMEGLDRLLNNIAMSSGRKVRLLVLDPAGDFINADENDATFVKMLMRHLRTVATHHSCTIILIGHVAKGMDADNPSMRGSGAWVANSRFAYALWKPVKEDAEKLSDRVGAPADTLVCGNLVKANHAGAPVGRHQVFSRLASGHLLERSACVAPVEPPEDELLNQLVEACAECAAAGLPFTVTGEGGLYSGRADLPEPLASMSKHRLESLGNTALDRKLLVKALTAGTRGSPKFLDVPDGPLAMGSDVARVKGSRREALERLRASQRPVDEG